MDTTIFNKILENGDLFIPQDRQPLEEKEILSQAEDTLGQVPDWYLHHKEKLTLSRLEVEDSTKKLRHALSALSGLFTGTAPDAI